MEISLQIIMISVAIIAAQWTAWRLQIPAIIFLLAFGFILGPIGGLVQPDILMGDLFRPFVAAAVAIILFEGSLQLHFKELRETQRAVRRIIFLGAPVGWALISCGAYYIAGLEWAVSVTLGGILIVTGPTVIMPLLRQARLDPRAGSVLKWEGIVNDPVGVIFAILAYEYFVAAKEGHAGAAFFVENGLMVVSVVLASFLAGHLIKRFFVRGNIPEYLKTPFLLCFVVALFFGCDYLVHESGLIAVTVLGVTLANIYASSLEDIKRFKETITIMLVSGVFILLTADLDARVLLELNWRGALFILTLLFMIRPLTFFLCSFGTHMTHREILLTGLIAPRGVVCAAMAGVIGPLLVEAGFADGDKILPIAFAVVVVSVVLHSLMIKPLARYLDLTSDDINGVMIVGAYPWSIQLAETLQGRNVPVILIDNDWNALSKARLADIPVYYGELLSEETEFSLELGNYNSLIAATPNPAYNALICEQFGSEFGRERTFRIDPDNVEQSSRQKISEAVQGQSLISDDFTLGDIWRKYQNGWRFRITRVGRTNKDSELIIPEENDNRVHIGMISKAGVVTFYSDDPSARIEPKEDEFLIILQYEG